MKIVIDIIAAWLGIGLAAYLLYTISFALWAKDRFKRWPSYDRSELNYAFVMIIGGIFAMIASIEVCTKRLIMPHEQEHKKENK